MYIRSPMSGNGVTESTVDTRFWTFEITSQNGVPMKNPFTSSTSSSNRLAGIAIPVLGRPVDVTEDGRGNRDSEAILEYLQKSMARDLHDSFPQEFQAVIMHLRVALETNSCSDAKHHVEQAIAAAQTGLNCVRGLIRDLRQNSRQTPNRSPVRRVVDVVSRAARGALKTHSVDFELENELANVTIRGSAALHLAMIVREAVHNALKHGAPSKICCRIFALEQAVVIELRDNGKGFSKDIPGSGFGLIGMQERASAMGASLKILSARLQGCVVRVTLPSSATTQAPPTSGVRLAKAPPLSHEPLPLTALDRTLRGQQAWLDNTESPRQLVAAIWHDEMEHAAR